MLAGGNRLPRPPPARAAFNVEQAACLTNSKFDDFPTSCDIHNAKSARLCPCGDPLPEVINCSRATPQTMRATQ